jgi:hypothetical protein
MSDRRLWLEEPCPTCGAPSGLRCQTSRYRGTPMRVLHAARGWRQRSCPACKAEPGELCRTPTGRRAAQSHTARLDPRRRELFAEQGVWEELERWGAFTALVPFSGGGASQGAIAAVTLEDAKNRELARWSGAKGELTEALAAPVWGRYALFRGHPPITGLVIWNVPERLLVVAGERGAQKFDDVLMPKPLTRASAAPVLRDTSPASGARAERDTSPAAGAGENAGSCGWCGGPIPDGLRPAARYCKKACRQAASRARLKDRPPSPPPSPAETCAWCGGSMPTGLRLQARFCSKQCRQASSRHALRLRRSSAKTSAPHDTSRPRRAKALG